MPVLADKITDPTLTPLKNVRVVAHLVNEKNQPVTGTVGNTATIAGRAVATPSITGAWSMTLPANDNIRIRSGKPTRWRIRYTLRNQQIGADTYLTMPTTGGPYKIRDLVFLNEPSPPALEGARMGLGGGQGFTDRAKNDKPRALQDLDLIASLGMKWVLFNVDWPEIEPTQGQQDWTVWDWIVTEAKKRQLKVISAALGAPTWANGGGPRFCPPDEAHRDEYAAWAARMATHGADAILLWNEPNNPLFWRTVNNVGQADAEAYAELVVAAYPTIHAANPDCKVIAGTTAPNGGTGGGITPIDFVEQCLEVEGFAESFEHYSHHPYQFSDASGPLWSSLDQSSTDKEWNALFQTRDIWAALVDAGRTDAIWLTEFGMTTDSVPKVAEPNRQITEAWAKSCTEQYYAAFDKLRSEGVHVDVMIQYAMSDNGPLSSTNDQDHFGQVRYDRSEKPQVAVLREQAKKTQTLTAGYVPPIPPPLYSQVYDAAVYDSSTYA